MALRVISRARNSQASGQSGHQLAGTIGCMLDHEYIAAIVNARHPGKGTWQLLPKLDHGFALHESLKDSVAHEFVGPFGEQVA